jgi:hypothetical protein
MGSAPALAQLGMRGPARSIPEMMPNLPEPSIATPPPAIAAPPSAEIPEVHRPHRELQCDDACYQTCDTPGSCRQNEIPHQVCQPVCH